MIGIHPADIVPLDEQAGVPDAAARFVAVAADWIEDCYGANCFVWDQHWHYAPYELLAQAFTREELIRLWHSCIFYSALDKHFEEHEALVWKVRHSLWRYGGSRNYQRFVSCYNGLGRLSIDLPDFEVRITHTRYCNTAAWAAHGQDNPIYLDASFGALVYYRGKHVMTIGFALSEYGILVAQVQLREKRGNRFLYKLPIPYLDFALAMLQRAFPADSLCLVTGVSTTAAIRAAYGKSDCLAPLTAQRIQYFYDQPLCNYTRLKAVQGSSDDGRVFARLESRHTGPFLSCVIRRTLHVFICQVRRTWVRWYPVSLAPRSIGADVDHG